MRGCRAPLWRDRLLKFKRAGINCVEIYTLLELPRTQARPVQLFRRCGFRCVFVARAIFRDVRHRARRAVLLRRMGFGRLSDLLRNVPGLEVRTDNEPFKRAVSGLFRPSVAYRRRASDQSRRQRGNGATGKRASARLGHGNARWLLSLFARQVCGSRRGSALLFQRPSPQPRSGERPIVGFQGTHKPLVFNRILAWLV